MIVQPEDNLFSVIQTSLAQAGLYSPEKHADQPTWRISPEPFYLSEKEVEYFRRLGPQLLEFYTALNQLYLDSAKGKALPWIAEYLDAGKPSQLLDFGRMKKFRRDLPGIIRPDVIPTENGFAVTELDSVPGGFGLTDRLMRIYQDPGYEIVGEMIGEKGGGIQDLFYRMMASASGKENPSVAIVVSEEAADYLGEMKYLAAQLRARNYPVYAVRPGDLTFREDGLSLVEDEGEREIAIDAIYRFFELFDLKNIPKAELMMYAHKKGRIVTTPPYKPFLEEKSVLALFHHPALRPYWEKALTPETFDSLVHLIPSAWILDNRELPPHAVVPGLKIGGRSVGSWKELRNLTQKERELAIKTSGFSPLAWGGRGVTIGHDVSSEEWNRVLDESLANFPDQPAILQEFHKGKRVRFSYYHPNSGQLEEMDSRARLTPYYFLAEGQARLGGILATLCPHDKKKIHGMSDAVMVPCAIRK